MHATLLKEPTIRLHSNPQNRHTRMGSNKVTRYSTTDLIKNWLMIFHLIASVKQWTTNKKGYNFSKYLIKVEDFYLSNALPFYLINTFQQILQCAWKRSEDYSKSVYQERIMGQKENPTLTDKNLQSLLAGKKIFHNKCHHIISPTTCSPCDIFQWILRQYRI